MVEKISLRLFITFMLLCASSVLIALWFGPEKDPWWFKFMPTFFIIGFASFIVWAVGMVYAFLGVSQDQE